MTSTGPTRNETRESPVVGAHPRLLDRILHQSKLIFFFGGLILLFAGWTVGDQAIANQNIAIARGFTACGLLVTCGLCFVASAIVYHRDGSLNENQAF